MSGEQDGPRPVAEETRRVRALRVPAFLLAALVLGLDQGTKVWALSALSDGRTREVIGDHLTLQLIYNPGAAFSIGTGVTWVFALVAAIVVVVLTRVVWRVRSWSWAIGLGLVLGGAATHLLDRLFRQPGFGGGHVVDFIDYSGFFVGNVADIAIVGGAALLAVVNLSGTTVTGRRSS